MKYEYKVEPLICEVKESDVEAGNDYALVARQVGETLTTLSDDGWEFFMDLEIPVVINGDKKGCLVELLMFFIKPILKAFGLYHEGPEHKEVSVRVFRREVR